MSQALQDYSRRFMFAEAPVRGEIVRLRQTMQEVLIRHPYPSAVQKLLGQTLAAAALLNSILKYEGFLILQLESEGPVSLLLAQINAQHHIRGLAKWQGEAIPTEFSQAITKGQLAITIKPGKGQQSYQGVVPLNNAPSLASVLETYFIRSEQLPTALLLAADDHQAVGLLLQRMPQEGTLLPSQWQAYHDHLAHISAADLFATSDEDLITQFFFKQPVNWYPAKSIEFVCRCSRDAMANAIITLGHAEASQLAISQNGLVVTCEFCNSQQVFDRVDVERVFQQHNGM